METLIEASVLDPNCRMSTNLVSKGDIAPVHKPLSNACQFSLGHSPRVKDVFLVHNKETKKHQQLNKNIVLPRIDTCTCQLHEGASISEQLLRLHATITFQRRPSILSDIQV